MFRDAANADEYFDTQLDEIDDIRSGVVVWAREQQTVLSDWSSDEFDALQEAREEAEERIREKYGEELSLALPACVRPV